MPLTMRPTGLGHASTGRLDFGVFSGEWLIGRIYEQKASPEVRFFWSLHGEGDD
jgi:hypothetical protein